MKKTIKQLISAVLSAVLITASMAGCNGNGGSGSSAAQTAASGAQGSAGSSAVSSSGSGEHPHQEFDELPYNLTSDSCEGASEEIAQAADYKLAFSVNLIGNTLMNGSSESFYEREFNEETKHDDVIYTYIVDKFVPDISDDDDFEVKLDEIKKPDQVLEKMKKQVERCAGDSLQSIVTFDNMKITNKENVTINGWDMCKYKGTFDMPNKDNLDLTNHNSVVNFVAYSVIKDGYPVYIMYIDVSKGQKKGAVIEDLADKSAKTFQDNKLGGYD